MRVDFAAVVSAELLLLVQVCVEATLVERVLDTPEECSKDGNEGVICDWRQSKVCHEGRCVSVCHSRGLEECSCTKREDSFCYKWVLFVARILIDELTNKYVDGLTDWLIG